MKVSELTGLALDWAVAKCEGFKVSRLGHGNKIGVYRIDGESWYETRKPYNPSTEWEQGGPIIQREGMELLCNVSPAQAKAFKNANPDWFACLKYKRADHWHGPTPLIAAMRCYVASKLGDTVEVPAELI